MITSLVLVVCFIACHGGPADHFSTFSKELEKKGYKVQIYASGPALKKFQEREVENLIPFSLDNISEVEAAVRLARKCSEAAVVITDVGDAFDISLQKALSVEAPQALRFAYYDNPEPYVPGGYSAIAAKVMVAADRVLFANANLAKSSVYQAPSQLIELPPDKRVGIGYYPISQAEKIAKRRAADPDGLRMDFFSKYRLFDRGQKVLVYAGGNNDEFFSKAFPAFLQFLATLIQKKDFSDFVVLLQRHPGAKGKNIDGKLVQSWISQYGQSVYAPKILISDFNSDDAQVLADGMLYYQTSMGPQFVLAGIPTIQVGHECYADILVKNNLCSVANGADELLDALVRLQKSMKMEQYDVIRQGLGMAEDWVERLEQVLIR